MLPTGSVAPRGAYASLRHVPFRLFVASIFTMELASHMRAVVVGWQIYAATHDPLALGLIGLAEVLPFFAVVLFAGHVADTANRKYVSVLALAALCVCALALFLLVAPDPSRQPVIPIYCVIAVSGVARSFLSPARTAMAAELVPREDYENSAAWRSSAWQLAAVGGPAMGGLLYGYVGAHATYALDLTLSLVALATLARVPYVRERTTAGATALRDSLSDGIRFVLSQPVILAALALDMFSVLFGGAVALLPVFANEILHVGPKGLGVLQAAPAAGAVVMSFYIAHRPPMQRAGRDLLIAVAVFGASIVAFALSRSFVLSLVVLAISGMADNISVVIRSTLLQVFTPRDMLGRVSAVNSIFIGSSNELGAFESGLAARLLGTVRSVVFGGCMTIGVVLVTAARVPSLRRLRQISGAADVQ
ncbi:MAG: MFS transporter [Gemmatimonadaceae bacterium]